MKHHPMRRLETQLQRLLIGLGVIVCSACATGAASPSPTPNGGAATSPLGIVDDPCPPQPPIGGGPPPTTGAPPQFTEAQLQAIQQEVARRLRLDWGGLCRYRDANDALAGAPAPRAVFMGDSITEFWSRGDPSLFVEGVVNRGISGQTSPQMLVRFSADVVALHPAVVHIMAGTNDLASNTGPSRPEDFKNNIRAMTEIAQANGIAVVLASIPPAAAFPWRPEVEPAPIIAELNAWLERYAAENDLVFVDYTDALSDLSGAMKLEFSGDGVHPNADGYAAMRPLTLAALAAAGVSGARADSR